MWVCGVTALVALGPHDVAQPTGVHPWGCLAGLLETHCSSLLHPPCEVSVPTLRCIPREGPSL